MSRLTPTGAHLVQATGSVGDPARAVDRDTVSALTVTGSATIVLDLERPTAVSRLRIFGRPAASFSVSYANGEGWTAVPGLAPVATSQLGDGWNTLQAEAPFVTSSVRVDVAASSPGASVPEIELWGAATLPLVPASSRRLLLAAESDPPDSLRVFESALAESTVGAESVTATIDVPRAPVQFRRAYLVYELGGLSSWTGVPRAINDRPAAGGMLVAPQSTFTQQIERINPDWLRAGSNEIAFAPAPGGLPYAVRRVRLLVELDTAGNAIERVAGEGQDDVDRGLHAASDGDPATGWAPFGDAPAPGARAALTLTLDRTIEPTALGVLVPVAPTGALELRAVRDDGGSTVLGAWSATALVAGWNLLPVPPGTAASRLRVEVESGSGTPWSLLEIVPIGSGVGSRFDPPALSVVWPAEGEFAGREAYVRGFLTPIDGGDGAARITVGGAPVDAADGSFGVTVNKDDLGYFDDADDAPWAVTVQAVYPGGRTVTRTVRLTRALAPPESIDGQLLGARSFSVRPEQARKIRHDGAGLDLEQGSVESPKDLVVTPLKEGDLPALDLGMTNVTRSPRRGYRFEPHGTRFTRNVRVTIPYDLALLPEGMSEEDIRTFYFDDQSGRWRPLERVSVDTAARAIVSHTDHFTDMINGTLAVPDHPEPLTSNPTQFSKLPPADPGDRIALIAPPKAQSTGGARVAYPFELPQGRNAVDPDLTLAYESGGANGWTGLGWSLTHAAVAIDTRWGVPRFSATHETESYLLQGEQLTPAAHREAPSARTADKIFQQRREGSFARIVRHGADPASYWWEVTDKRGMTSVYGGDAGAVLADDSGRIVKWLLREVRDPRGNGIRYDFARVDDTGLVGGTVLGRQLYLQTINYTTFAGQPGPFTIRFVRDADLGEPRRIDVGIDARGGFKEVTSQLLRRVEVSYAGATVRSWTLAYRRGAFEKTLLESITQAGADGSVLAVHRFDYFDDVRENGAYVGFAPTESWDTGSDDVGSDAVDAVASLAGSDAGRASALSGYETTHAGGHLYAGFNPDAPTKSGSVGGKVGFNGTVRSEGLLALVDLNGDALPDKVFKTSAGVFFRMNLSGPRGAPEFGPAVAVTTLPAIAEESASTFSFGVESYLGVTLVANAATGLSSARLYFADVNGDGLTDLVDGGNVLFNHLDASGTPTFGADSAASPVAVGPAAVDGPAIVPDYGPQRDQILASAPLQDTLRRWVAPFAGTLVITGDVGLDPGADAGVADDGVRVAIQHNGTELWSAAIDAGDTTARSPEGVDAVAVQAGDRIYFRVGSRSEGSHDRVLWDPEIVYSGAPARTDANGLNPWRFKASEDFTFAGRPGIRVKAPFTGRVRLVGDLRKTGVTTDAALLLVLKNGAQVHADVLQADEIADAPLGISFDVAQDDEIQLRVKVDSPIDLSKIEWVPSLFYEGPPGAPAPTHTVDGTTVTITRVTDAQGVPLIQLHPAYDIDAYPVDGLSAPQSPYVAEDTEEVSISSHLTADPGTTGVVFMTAKRRGALIAKRTIVIKNGNVANRTVDVDVEEDDEIFLDYSCFDPELAARIHNRVIKVDGDEAPSAFHVGARQGVFPLGYRGWGFAGYNGTPPRDAAPVIESDLDVAFDEDTTLDPRTAKVYLYAPFPEGGVWRGPEEETFVASTGAGSSRLGPNAVPIPDAAGMTGRAPLRLSSSSQAAAQVGVAFLSGSFSEGSGRSDLDFLDMNGDRFPDVVGRQRIQYSPALGGLEPASVSVGALTAPRETESSAANVGVGGSPASFKVGSRGQVDTPGRGGSAKENTTGSQMAALGLSGGLGSGSSALPYDLNDLNGDGLPDRVTRTAGGLFVAFNLGYGFAAAEPWGPGSINNGASASASIGANLGFNGGIYDYAGGVSLSRNASETTATLADVNGDGLPDRVTRDAAGLVVGLNTGAGFLADTAWAGGPSGPFAASADASVGGGAYFTVGIGPVCIFGCWVILNPGADVSTGLSRQEAALVDIDGDGYIDQLASVDDAHLTVARNRTGRTNLLRSIGRPLGARIELDYERDGNTPDQPASRWVLSRVAVDDGFPGDGVDRQLATLRYENGRWDRLEREFYGYAKVIEDIRDTARADALYRTITRTFSTGDFYTHGLLLKERLADADARPFVETEHTYEVRDVGTGAPLVDLASTTATGLAGLVRTDRRWFEGEAAPGKTSYSTQELDALGNVVRTFDAGDAGTEDDLEATFEYGACTASHIVGVPVAMTVRGGGTELRRRTGALDCATGNIGRITEFLASGTGAATDLEHDAFGNLTRVAGPPNRSGQRYDERYAYDPAIQTFVAGVTDSYGLSSSTTWDPAQGRKLATVDVNGQRTSYTYDTHGRLTSLRGPYEQGAGPATATFEYHPEAPVPWSLSRHADTFRSPSDTIDAVRFVDGLLRPLQGKADATLFTGASSAPSAVMTVSGRVTFDAVGRVVDRYYPTTEPLGTAGVFRAGFDAVPPTHTAFDVMDRPTRVTLPDLTATDTSYLFGPDRDGVPRFEARAVDAGGAVSSKLTDVRDLMVARKDLNRVGAGVETIWTSYGHDALKRLVRITDDRGNVTRIAFDNLGRKTSVDSPDAGRTEDVYDLAGNRTAQITANLRALGRQIDYDFEFRRVTQILYPDFPGNNVTYTYGAPGATQNRAGRVTTIVDQGGMRSRGYGKLGEVVSETRTIASATPDGLEVYTTGYTYDSFNRLQRLVYPDGEALTFSYDAGGKVRAIAGVKAGTSYEYLRRKEYDKFGEDAFDEIGNGARTTLAYRPDNRRLAVVTSVRPDGRTFVNRSYAYDAVGNVLSVTNAVPVATGSDFGGPSTQSYVYDDLDRLLHGTGSYAFAPDKTSRYAVSIGYDSIFNMTARAQLHEIVGPSGTAIPQQKTSYAYQYAYTGPQPHAATHVGDRSFAFDANGNQAGWQDDRNGTRRNVVWDEENRMQSLVDNGHQIQFTYDDEGQRVTKRGPQGETVYVNPWFTVRNGTTGTKHVWAGTMRVTSKLMKQDRPGGNPSGGTPVEKDRYFYHADPSGSVNYVSDADGRLYEHFEYFPFGEAWVQESSNTQRTPYQFTGKELDEETGLAYFDARYLDPRLGSFNAAEPLVHSNPEHGRDDPRFLSVYSYAYQSPIRYSDPDGREVLIVVGHAGPWKDAETQIVRSGFPAAARNLQGALTKQKIGSSIVNVGTKGGITKESFLGAVRAGADKIIAKGGKVTGIVYIGHGDIGNKQMSVDGNNVTVTVREAIQAGRLSDKGSFTAYGCEVSVGSTPTDLKNRGIHVYTTTGRWTWTSAGGQAALGTKKKPETPYGNIWDLRLADVVFGVDIKTLGPLDDPTKPMIDGLKSSENDVK